MCGITGAIWTDPAQAISSDILKRMTDALTHRGPDGSGQYESEFALRDPYPAQPGIGLGHRRLSIVDLEGGAQPLSNEDGTIWIAFNGEIYNFPALRKRLEGAGHTFQTNCDTEAIVHLYEDEGVDAFQHLNGMFAIAIWDSNRRRLVLARDRVGQKPLYYRQESNRLLFGSELKSILEVPGVPRELDANALDEYLTYQYIPHPNTIFRGIKKLPPGHLAVFEDGNLKVNRFWQPDLNHQVNISEQDAIEQLRETLTSSVKMRLQSDVPLGAFLSGGIDSSIVVAIMQSLVDEPVKTFTMGFAQSDYDESKYAREVAAHLGTEHHEFPVTPDAVEVLDQLVWHYDEPFADSSAIPTWYLSQQTKKHVTVALTGDGGDELFAGYSRYKAVRTADTFDRLPVINNFLSMGLWQKVPTSSRQKSLPRLFKRFCESLKLSPVRRYHDWTCVFNELRRATLYTESMLESLDSTDPCDFYEQTWSKMPARDAITQASLTDLNCYLPCDLMTKVDIASMAHSLECRQPLLDYRLMEFAIGLPVQHKYKRGHGKKLLQKAFGHMLPKNVFKRKKMGFGVPLEYWFRNELKPLTEELLLASDSPLSEYLSQDAMRNLNSEHQSGVFNHAHRLWSLVVLAAWMRRWL